MEEEIIRYAEIEDIPKLMKFIDEHWRKGHILATNRAFFEWQCISDGQVTFVLGINEKQEIVGTLGFIPYTSGSKPDIALMIWKSISKTPFLGMKMLVFLLEKGIYGNVFTVGNTMRTTASIYSYLGFQVDAMQQWYRLGKCKEYKIADIQEFNIPTYQAKQLQLIKYSKKDIEQAFGVLMKHKQEGMPDKSLSYILKRYFEHPIYQYLVYGILDESQQVTSSIVLRIQEYDGKRAIRFVDCIGDSNKIFQLTEAFDKLLEEYGAEYIDMYETGLSKEKLQKAGWTAVEDSKNIIPNHFAPFEQKNIKIHYSTQEKNVILFRGDGDQDRPS